MNRDYLEIELGSFPLNARNRSVKIKRTERSETVTQKVRIGNRFGVQRYHFGCMLGKVRFIQK